MPLKKLAFKSGVNRENTRYTTEGGYYDCDKIRFRQGTPEKIGGWQRISTHTFLGVCRSLWQWITLEFLELLGVGTNLKFYIENDGVYHDITPVRYFSTSTATISNPFDTTNGSKTVVVNAVGSALQTGDGVSISNVLTNVGGIPFTDFLNYFVVTRINDDSFSINVPTTATSTVTGGGGSVDFLFVRNVVTLTNPFSTTINSATVVVTHNTHGAKINDFVTFSNASAVGGLTLNGTYQITQITSLNTYKITAASTATSTVAAGGGTVYALYEINTGPAFVQPYFGWGAGPWGFGTWGVGSSEQEKIRLWSQSNFGEDLVFAPRNGAIYYWDATKSLTSRGFAVALLPGATDVPEITSFVFVVRPTFQ